MISKIIKHISNANILSVLFALSVSAPVIGQPAVGGDHPAPSYPQ